jgi:hypothetical protein
MGTGALYLGLKQPGREVDHSPPSSAEVKNGEAIPPFLSMSPWHSALIITHRDDFTCTLQGSSLELVAEVYSHLEVKER